MIKNIIPAIETEVKEHLLLSVQKNTLLVYVNFIIGEDGKPIEESFNISKLNNNDNFEKNLKSAILKLPKIHPRRNEYNNPILTYYHLTLNLGLDNSNNIIVLEDSNEPKEFSESSEFTAPIYPKCESTTNKGLKKCFSNAMTKLIVKKYNYPKAIKGFNKKGTFYTFILFIVNKEGEINDYKAFAPNENFKREALKSLTKVKNLKPGTRNNKPINVSYSIPLKLKLK